jgi:hypothetical protein
MKSVPYASATAGAKAREEVATILRRFGCESVGFMDDYVKNEVILAFTHRGRQVQLRASAAGWAKLYLDAKPQTRRSRYLSMQQKQRAEQAALRQGHVAVNSILRDWIKGQVTAIECGILSFEAVFLPFMLANDGRTFLEVASAMLPSATPDKIVKLPGPVA